jgi:hypothetical protein
LKAYFQDWLAVNATWMLAWLKLCVQLLGGAKIEVPRKKIAAGLAGTATANITSLPDRDLLQFVAVPAKTAATENRSEFNLQVVDFAYRQAEAWTLSINCNLLYSHLARLNGKSIPRF